MKRIIAPALSIFLLAVTTPALGWDVSLDMDQNPWSDTPAWSGRGNLISPTFIYGGERIQGTADGADGYYREMNVSTSQTHTCYFELSGVNFDPDFTGGFTYEARFRIHNGTIPGSHSINARSDGDGGTTEDGTVIISPYYRYASGWFLGLRLGTGFDYIELDLLDFYTPQAGGPTGWLPTPWIVVRAVVKNGEIKFYVNGELRHTDTNLSSDFSGVEEAVWGDLSTGAAGHVDYDYIRVQYGVRDPFPDFLTVNVSDTMAMEVETTFGLEYALEGSTDGGSNWDPLGFTVTGDGNIMNLYDPTGFDTGKLYRVVSPP